MRIAHVIHTFPPYSRAGSENYVEMLAREQMRSHDVVVFHRVDEPDRPEYEVVDADLGGLPVVRLNRTFRDVRSFADTYRSDAVAEPFGAFLERWRPDLVHFHHVTCLSTTCVHRASQLGIPVVFTLHDFWLLCPRGQFVRRDLSLCERHTEADCVRCMAHQLSIRGGHARVRALWRRAGMIAGLRLPAALYRRAATWLFSREEDALEQIRARDAHVREMCALVGRFVSPSEFLRQRFLESGIPGDRLRLVRNGYDPSRFDGVRRVAAPGPLRIVYLGTWIPSKGVHLLVEAFRGIEPDRAVLDLHGYAVPYDGFEDYEGHLRRLAADAPGVRFRGAYGPEEVPGILAAADALVVPSLWYENSPLTVHEGLLARVPVVAAAHGGIQEFVRHERNGLTFEPGSARSLRRALERLIRDPGLLDRLRRAVPEIPSIRENAASLERLYEEVRRETGR